MHRIAITTLCFALILVGSATAQSPEDADENGTQVSAEPGAEPDAEIGMRVTMALKDDPAWGRIRVDRVDHGVVWLQGSVRDEGRLVDALEAIEEVEGVREIRNDVRVDSTVDDGSTADDAP